MFATMHTVIYVSGSVAEHGELGRGRAGQSSIDFVLIAKGCFKEDLEIWDQEFPKYHNIIII